MVFAFTTRYELQYADCKNFDVVEPETCAFMLSVSDRRCLAQRAFPSAVAMGNFIYVIGGHNRTDEVQEVSEARGVCLSPRGPNMFDLCFLLHGLYVPIMPPTAKADAG